MDLLNGHLVLVLLSHLFFCHGYSLGPREFPQLTSSEISTLLSISDPVKNVDPYNPASHLAKILIPRVADTANNTLVGNYIINTMKALDWHIDLDEFSDRTPIGVKRFRNIIATKDPKASRRVILAAHYDSKYFPSYPENQFLGATDSAAPCAMLLDVAEALDSLLDDRKELVRRGLVEDEEVAQTTLQIIFFDGEEAFVSWTEDDSTYGSRHLAEKWELAVFAPHDRRRLGFQMNELSGIEHFILLDLLGAPQPSIRSYFLETNWLFDALRSVENRLGERGDFAYGSGNYTTSQKWVSYFRDTTPLQNIGYVSDDHVPFLRRGISVLHLIPEPFPRVWHTIKDDAKALDIPSMRRWNIMLRLFMAEYLHLHPDALRRHSRLDGELDQLNSSWD